MNLNVIKKGLRKYGPVFQEAKDNDLKEADTVTRIIKFLEEVLEYDRSGLTAPPSSRWVSLVHQAGSLTLMNTIGFLAVGQLYT